MSSNSRLWIQAAALAGTLLAAQSASAQTELVYGSWPPAGEYLNRVALPKAFAAIEKETNGQIKWKLVPGGQLANPKDTFQAIQDGVMASGLEISQYVPNLVPSLNAIYTTAVFGKDDAAAVIAASGGAVETVIMNCPSCLEEFRKINTVPLPGWTSSGYYLACRDPIRSLADLKGKRVRAAGGHHEMMNMAGAVPVSATLVEAVGLLQRGGLDCQLGVHNWLKVFGYADFAKHVTDFSFGLSGPAVGLPLNRDVWNKMTTEQKRAHMKQAAYISASLALGQFVIENEADLKLIMSTKGVQLVKPTDEAGFVKLTQEYDKAQRERNIENAKKFGVKDPAAIIAAYDKNREKWAKLAPAIGQDIDKFADAIWREVYSKVDPSKL
ncbi:MAG: TRAP transporter substrate-binding protein DctP [Bradyrhizobiaceae bacterium]|nr:TRAP transporter substrate-binding protein DctP [Bradyrhizobiaceae bacterium]